MIAIWKQSEWLLAESEVSLQSNAEALQFGMGLFETINYQNGIIEYLEQHIQRLKASCEALKIKFSLEYQVVLLGFMTLIIHEKKLTDFLALKMSVYKCGNESEVLLSYKPHPYAPEAFSKGVVLGFFGTGRLSQSRLVRHKTTNYFENMLLREEALNQGWFDGVFLNEQGYITEGCSVNVFFELQGCLYTPSLENGLLPGVMRQVLLDKARNADIEVCEGNFKWDMLMSADKVYITNSLIGVQPVVRVMDKNYSIESSAIAKVLFERP